MRGAVLAVGALLLAACGVNPAGAEGNNTTPQHGGSLKVGLEYEPRTLDPLYADSAQELQVLRQMFEPLLDVDSKGRITPKLATGWETSDPTALHLRLRRGIVFQNGEPFDSRAVKFTLDRELRARDSPRAQDLRNVASVQVDGPGSVTIRLKRSDPGLLARLAGPAGMMLSPVGVTSQGAEYEFARNPVVAGTGPFMFQFWLRGYHLILKRFPRYWGPAPFLDQLDFTQTDLALGLARLRSSDLDVIEQLPRDQVVAAAEDPNLLVTWRPGSSFQGIELNQAPGAVFADPGRRRAVAAAVDRAGLSRQVLAGIDTPAPVPQLAPSLAQFTFTLKVDTEQQHLAEAELLRSQLDRAGVRLQIQPEDPDRIHGDLAAHDFDAALVTLGGSPYSDFHTGGADNFGAYSNPQVDAALDAGRDIGAAALVANDAGFVFLVRPPLFDARGDWVRGVAFNADGTFNLDRAWLA